MEFLLQKITTPLAILAISFTLIFLGLYPDLSSILGGIALFLIGMEYMESGFKGFSGGFLEKVLQKFTNNTFKAITTGFFATAVVQSSSLISIIVISFLSAGLISLSSAIGVIFGSNIGTTATAWLVSLFGLKIKISAYAMPMIIMGIIIPLILKKSSWRGVAAIFIGLGVIFLGISYMKEGFETLKEGIDLALYAMDGYLGVFVYVLVGAIATIIIQSSSATMALIITALASGQIEYTNALALAIGANLGTTVTAVLGALKSNENGKRLALAHFIFNMITGTIAIAFIYQLTTVVDIFASIFGITNNDIAMKLALFHTIFNIIGVIVCSPFISQLVKFLEKRFIHKKVEAGKAKYLDETMLAIPDLAITAVRNEVKHLFSNAFKVIAHGINIKKENLKTDMDASQIISIPYASEYIDIDKFYHLKIKNLYGQIIEFATKAQMNMDQENMEHIYKLKLASRDVVEALKDTKHLQKNLIKYSTTQNNEIKTQYTILKKDLAELLRLILRVSELTKSDEIILLLSKTKLQMEKYDKMANEKLDELIRQGNISLPMATSLMNDSAYVYDISKHLIEMAEIIFVDQNVADDILIDTNDIHDMIEEKGNKDGN
jgi:phosphate:Na+ symporter